MLKYFRLLCVVSIVSTVSKWGISGKIKKHRKKSIYFKQKIDAYIANFYNVNVNACKLLKHIEVSNILDYLD